MFNLKKILLAVSAIMLCGSSHAFDVANFKTGMTKSEVQALMPGWGFDKILDTAPDTILAYDNLDKETHRRFRLQFCNDRLAGVEQWMKASPKHLVVITGNYTRQYGQPYWVDSGVSVVSSGEKHSMFMSWRNNEDFISVRYAMFTIGEDLSVFHESPNSCWKAPQKP